MVEQDALSYFLRPSPATVPSRGRASTGPIDLDAGEQVLWHGRAGVAEHLYSETMDCSIVRWVLPSSTEVVVTDRRLAYVQGVRPPATLPPRSWPPYPAPGRAVGRHRARVDERMSGGVHWQWPDHLHVRPGNPPRFGPDGVRSAQPTQVRLVCRTGPTGGHPTLVLSGGDLVTVEHADRLANLLRRVIAQFRLEHVDASTLSATQSRALARRLIGPEFANHLGGASQAVSLPGALPLGTSGHTTAMTADRARAS